MQTNFKVIVERRLDHWSAWFDGFPDLVRDGDCHDDAVLQLLDLFGEELFDLEQVVVIGESASDDHLEMIIPLRSLRRVAPPSVN